MEAKLEMFMRNLVVYEKGEDRGNETKGPQPKS
jgi:hypothetical protein